MALDYRQIVLCAVVDLFQLLVIHALLFFVKCLITILCAITHLTLLTILISIHATPTQICAASIAITHSRTTPLLMWTHQISRSLTGIYTSWIDVLLRSTQASWSLRMNLVECGIPSGNAILSALVRQQRKIIFSLVLILEPASLAWVRVDWIRSLRSIRPEDCTCVFLPPPAHRYPFLSLLCLMSYCIAYVTWCVCVRSYFSSCKNATETTNPFDDAIRISAHIFQTEVNLLQYMQWGTIAQMKCKNINTAVLEQKPPKQPKKKSEHEQRLISQCRPDIDSWHVGWVSTVFPPSAPYFYQELCSGENNTRLETHGLMPLWIMPYDECESECRERGMAIPCFSYDIYTPGSTMFDLFRMVREDWLNANEPYSYAYFHVGVNDPSSPGTPQRSDCPQYQFNSGHYPHLFSVWVDHYWSSIYSLNREDVAICICSRR